MVKIYGTVDFEYTDPKKPRESWFAACLMVAKYPSGQILQTEEFRIPITGTKSQFWEKHPEAFGLNTSVNKQASRVVSEQRLIQFVNAVRTKYPHIHFVSDNPQLDIRILDGILEAHHEFPISIRVLKNQKHIYYPTLCTWTFRLATSQILGKYLPAHTNYRGVDFLRGTRHTPLVDCAKILSNHFKILDIHQVVSRNRTPG